MTSRIPASRDLQLAVGARRGCETNWIEATKIRLGKVVTLVDSINSNHILIGDMGVDDMEVGEIYHDTIDRVSLTGDGIISRDGDYLNLGHIDESMVGKEVVFRYKGKFRAEVIAKHEADADNPIKEPNRNENDLLNGHL